MVLQDVSIIAFCDRSASRFTLERWITESPFHDLLGSSELDVVRQARNAKERLERHWDCWMGEEDWRWIRGRGFNTVRIPVSRQRCLVW